MEFIDKHFENKINNVINRIFPNLINNEKQIIKEYTINIINYISIRFCFDLKNKKIYYEQFYQNDYRDIKSIIILLLPFIDDVNGTYILHNEIKLLSDITNITTINYDRSLNDTENYKFSKLDLEINLKLILDTINVVSNKLYINWLNCLPYNLKNYKDSLLWKESYKYDEIKNVFNIEPEINRNDMNYRGLHIYDIYNCCNQFLFQHILSTKWLIYEKLINVNDKPIMYIDELSNIFGLENILEKKYWEFLDDKEKLSITKEWFSKLISNAKKASNNKNLINKFHLGIIKNIILHFESYYNNYIIFSKTLYDDEINDKPKYIETNDYTIIIKNEKQINAEQFIELVIENYTIDKIYNFLIFSINEFYKTWYGKKIIKDNKINYLNISFKLNDNIFYLTYKNIYNFAKSLCFENFKYITEARCLDEDDLKKYIEKLNKTVNFPNVLKMTYIDIYNDLDLKKLSELISIEIKKILMEIVFESNIIYGLLSNFIPVKEVTDNQYKKNQRDNIQTIIFNDENIDNFKQSYYFVTNDKYEKLTCYNENKLINYIDLLKNGRHWFTPFALDWIYQMQFFHRFLNNRLIYVTGAPGQGKSTQVPKLLYYATKAFSLEFNPKVVSTQPRIKPTKENADTIANEMGLPIIVNNNNTFLDYIQYLTKEDKHRYYSKTYIREVIDKMLCDELLKDPMLEKSTYNVIIVDEAHEHNINMDLILTLMKSSLYFNNKIRFVITTATIDFDEPIYRKYYRNIDDNLLFPCNRNLLTDELDRIVVDRRTHISPPGETTRFIITELWEDKDPKNYEEAEKIGIKRALEIVEKNNGNGDVLFFSIGTNEIKRICKKLNEILPSHGIALPFYRELDDVWKDIATKPEKRENNLNFNKIDLFDKIEDKDVKEITTNYTTIIIVATNIAEASITIKNLSFVIDTGYVKSIPFDIVTNKNEIKIIPITNMNRLQRKGRVGRVADGTIYYTYSKQFLDLVEPNYNIRTTDFTIYLFKFLTSEEKYITNIIDQEKLIQKSDTLYIYYKNYDEYKKNIKSKIKSQFTYKNKLLFNPKGIEKIRNYDVLKVPERYIDGGFSIKDLIDENQTFYLIHPLNIDLYYNNCKKRKYILSLNEGDIKNSYINDILKISLNFTEIFGNDEDKSISMINTLIHSIKFECMEEVIKILVWIIIIKTEPYKICNKYKQIKNKSLYSDLLVLLELENMFKFEHDVNIENITPKKDILDEFIEWFNNKDDNKWFNIPEDYKKNYNFIFNKNTELGIIQYSNNILYTNGIIKNEIIEQYIHLYKSLKFSFNDELLDNELIKDQPLIKGYKEIKSLAEQVLVNRTNNNIHNILKSFLIGYNYIILDCNKRYWSTKEKQFIPHKEHFLDNINGLYFAIDYRSKNDEIQPIILSKIIDDEWIEEIN